MTRPAVNEASRRNVQMAKIVGLCTLAAVIYGVVHDQITVRICVEYFTIAHPLLFGSPSPPVLALCWGIAATFGVGLLFGMFLAAVSQSDNLPPAPIPRLLRSIIVLLAITAIAALLAGVTGYELSWRDWISLPATFANSIPVSQHDRFMAAWCAHLASYLVPSQASFACCA